MRIPSLDGFRAISFLLVFVSHAGLEQTVPGGFGVTVFFFLSGYLITTLMRVEYEKNGHVNLKAFWLRRAFRILPPFYLVLAATTIAALVFDPPATLHWPAVAAQVFHYTNYWIINHGYEGQPAGTGVYWSLAVEEHFYLLFPFLFIGMRKLQLSARTVAIVLWSLCGVVLLWRCCLVYQLNVVADRTYLATDTRVDSILFGCALAVWNNPVLDSTLRKEAFWKFVVLPGALLLLVFSLLYRDQVFRETLRYSIQGLGLTGLFAVAIRFGHWPLFGFLNSRVLSFLGKLSYSLYLVHLAVIFAVTRIFGASSLWFLMLLSFCLSLVLAWGIYETVEKPFASLRRRISN
jgi:peptidoglycan/LPS O-acetylase OafA/YrhL